MRAVINGKLYDPDLSTKVGSYNNFNGFPYGTTPDTFSETLYRTEWSEYFLDVSGGNESKYSINGKGYDDLLLLSKESARKWGKEHMDNETYNKEFGNLEAAESMFQELENYIFENYTLSCDAKKLISDTIQWAALQSMDEEDTVSFFTCVFDSIGITEEEIHQFITLL